MHDGWLLLAALLSSVGGLAWLALAMEVHWRQSGATEAVPVRAVIVLRTLGVAALLVSLLLCLRVDHISIASLVWVMSIATAALIVAFTLAWKPRCLTLLRLGLGREGN